MGGGQGLGAPPWKQAINYLLGLNSLPRELVVEMEAASLLYTLLTSLA